MNRNAAIYLIGTFFKDNSILVITLYECNAKIAI